MKFKFLAMFLLLCPSLTTLADGYRRVEIKEFNGNITSIDLSDNLKTEFIDGKVCFLDVDLSFEFDRKSVQSFSFNEIPTSITKPMIEKVNMNFNNLPVGSRIIIMSVSGNVVINTKVEGNYNFNVGSLPSGVYIVKVNNVLYKITLK